MQVESAVSRAHHGLALGHAKQATKSQPEQPPAEPAAPAPAGEQEAGQQRGVIRNLLNGHYKGVADVRLRINFFDELQALERGGVNQALSSTPPDLAVMQQELAGIMALGDELPPEVAEAAQAVDGLATQLAEAQDMSKAEALALMDQLSAAFADLVQLINDFLAAQAAAAEQAAAEAPPEEPPAEALPAEEPVSAEVPPEPQAASGDEPPTEPPAQEPAADQPPVEPMAAEPPAEEPPAAPADTEPDPGPDPVALVGDFLANWGDLSLLEQLSALEQSVGQVSSLPELSGPGSNNGKAYDKFLAIYEQMQSGGDPSAEPPEDAVPIDAVV